MNGTRTIEDLEQLVHGSPETRTTEITDNFSIDDYQKTHPDNVILFVTSADGTIRFPLGDDRIKEGDRVTAVVRPAAQD